MVDYTKLSESMTQIGQDRTEAVQSIFKSVYGWMTVGLLVSGAVAWFTVNTGFYQVVFRPLPFLLCVIGEFALVIALTAAIGKLSAAAAGVMFLLYAAVNGLTLSGIFLVYAQSTIETVFFITAGMFGGMALFGTMTKANLSGVGAFCGMGLWGLILASIVNIFVGSSGLDWILSWVGIIIFTGLTMWDAQKIRIWADYAAEQGGQTETKRVAVLGALELYLDFINLFLMILRLFGRRK